MKMKLWKKGLIVFIVGVILNMLFMNLGIGGLLREGSRLTSLIGLVVLVVGLVTKK